MTDLEISTYVWDKTWYFRLVRLWSIEMNKDMKIIIGIMNAWSVNTEMVDGWNRNEDIEMIT